MLTDIILGEIGYKLKRIQTRPATKKANGDGGLGGDGGDGGDGSLGDEGGLGGDGVASASGGGDGDASTGGPVDAAADDGDGGSMFAKLMASKKRRTENGPEDTFTEDDHARTKRDVLFEEALECSFTSTEDEDDDEEQEVGAALEVTLGSNDTFSTANDTYASPGCDQIWAGPPTWMSSPPPEN